ncbi:MAG TPA: RNA polymerase sigma factor [Candidatus Paceibacterota bacterium]|nr:RNA polymerase sigma factor [Candidatus Paceibacterota bacterium]
MTDRRKNNLRDLLEKTYEEHSDAIFRYCFYHTSNREKALDITQDTYVKTWEYLATEKGAEVKNIRAFLYKVARNLIIDGRRKKTSGSLDEMRESGFDLTREENEIHIREDQFEAKKAVEAIQNLDSKYKDVIYMRYIEDMTVKEIAKQLRKNENTVSVRIHRGMEKLKSMLEELDEE